MNVISSSGNDNCLGMMACKKVAATCFFLASGHGFLSHGTPSQWLIDVPFVTFGYPKLTKNDSSGIHPSMFHPILIHIYISICHHCIYTLCTYLYMCIYIILSHYYLQHNTRSCYMFIVHVFSYIHIISIASILPYNFPYHPFHIYLIIHYIYIYICIISISIFHLPPMNPSYSISHYLHSIHLPIQLSMSSIPAITPSIYPYVHFHWVILWDCMNCITCGMDNISQCYPINILNPLLHWFINPYSAFIHISFCPYDHLHLPMVFHHLPRDLPPLPRASKVRHPAG